ncbi:MAG TPA: hypothetical protein DCL73_11635 [Treponema sp.]|nr:hypothetical protein [Treponema sp.]
MDNNVAMELQTFGNKREPVEDWDKMYASGKGYKKAAHNARNRPAVFTPSIVRNICAMGIESYFMAVFMHRGLLPHNHTMRDLLDYAERLISIEPSLRESMLKIDTQMQLCSLDNIKLTEPLPGDIPLFLKALDDVAAIADGELGSDAVSPHT